MAHSGLLWVHEVLETCAMQIFWKKVGFLSIPKMLMLIVDVSSSALLERSLATKCFPHAIVEADDRYPISKRKISRLTDEIDDVRPNRVDFAGNKIRIRISTAIGH